MLRKSIICLPLLLSGCGLFIAGGLGNVGLSTAEDRGFTGYVSDQALRIRLNYILGDELDDSSGLNLTVYKGRVLITGVAADERTRRDAVLIVKRVSGVAGVIDGMNVQGEDGFAEYTRDAWMTTKLKASLYADDNVSAPNYMITTFDKIIYIFGTAQSNEERQRVLDSAYEITGVRKVVNLIEIAKMPQE